MRKTNQKSRFATTLVVFVVCLVLITGSTFSLFTSQTGANIAVTSGTVKMTANIVENSLTLLSKDVVQDPVEGYYYFENGGTAAFNEEFTKLTLTNITPGDKVEFTIALTNASNVNIQYRVNWAVKETVAEGETVKLSDVLVAKAGTVNIEESTPTWTEWDKPVLTDLSDRVRTINVSIEFPMGLEGVDYNSYMNKTLEIDFTVEAVQANGTMEYDGFVAVADGVLTRDGEYYISNANALTWLSAQSAETLSGKIVKLANNIDGVSGLTLCEGMTLDGNGYALTYAGTEYDYHLVKPVNGCVIKNITLNNYRIKGASNDSLVTLTNVTINMDNDLTGMDFSGGSGKVVMNNVKCASITDVAHLDPNTQVQVDYDPYGDILLGGTWALEATDCVFGSLHGWNTRNGSNVYLNNTTCTVFRMHYWSNRTLYINGVETPWSESGAIPVAHDVGGCWSVQPAFK